MYRSSKLKNVLVFIVIVAIAIFGVLFAIQQFKPHSDFSIPEQRTIVAYNKTTKEVDMLEHSWAEITFIKDGELTFNVHASPSKDITLLDPAVSMSIILNSFENDDDLEDIKQCIFLPLELDKKKFIFAPINDNTKIQYTCSGSHWTLNVVDVENNLIYYLDSTKGNVSNAHTFHQRIEKLFGK
jgi:hypothetical protein